MNSFEDLKKRKEELQLRREIASLERKQALSEKLLGLRKISLWWLALPTAWGLWVVVMSLTVDFDFVFFLLGVIALVPALLRFWI